MADRGSDAPPGGWSRFLGLQMRDAARETASVRGNEVHAWRIERTRAFGTCSPTDVTTVSRRSPPHGHEGALTSVRYHWLFTDMTGTDAELSAVVVIGVHLPFRHVWPVTFTPTSPPVGV